MRRKLYCNDTVHRYKGTVLGGSEAGGKSLWFVPEKRYSDGIRVSGKPKGVFVYNWCRVCMCVCVCVCVCVFAVSVSGVWQLFLHLPTFLLTSLPRGFLASLPDSSSSLLPLPGSLLFAARKSVASLPVQY